MFHQCTPPPPPNSAASGMTRRRRFAWTRRLYAILAASVLVLTAAPAAAQLTVSITSTPANGEYYVAGERITTRISGLPNNLSEDSAASNLVSDCRTRRPSLPATSNNGDWRCNWMRIDVGGTIREAEITTNPGGARSINYQYTVQAADLDIDGISIPANSIVGRAWRQGGDAITGAILNRNHAALGAQSDHEVAGTAASITSTNPSLLHEGNLNGATLTVSLAGVAFGSGVTTASFQLVTTMTGVSIASVSSVSSGDTTATLTLSSTADISADATLAVRVLAAAHTGSSNLTSVAVTVVPVAASIASTNPSVLHEDNLGGATVTVALSGVAFGSSVTTASFQLVTTMTGVSIASVSSVSSGDTTATLTLSSTADISADATLAVRVLAAAHTGSSNLTTGTVSVAPVAASISFTFPRVFGTVNLHGATIDVALSGVTYVGGATAASFELVTTMTGVSISSVRVLGGNILAELTLSAPAGVPVAAPLAVRVLATAHTGSTALTTGTVSVTQALATLSIDSPRVVEGGTGDTPTLDFTVTLAPAMAVQATVNYAHSPGGTATSGVDHAAIASGTLTFAPGETSKTISVTVTGDTMPESDEGVTLAFSNPTPSGVIIASGNFASGSIVDDDTPTLTIDSPRVAEGNAGTRDLTFTVTLSPAASSQQEAAWIDPGSGTAESGIDYTALAGGTLIFAAGETSKTIAVTVRGDSAVEPDETVRVVVASTARIRGADGNIAAFAIGVGTIANDDLPEPPEPNSTPQVVAAPGAVALDVGGTAAIALAGAFLDTDGDPLTLSAASSRPAVATARLDGTTLALAAAAEGQTRITVRAADPDGATATLSFLVTVGNPVSIGGGDGDVDDTEAVVVSAPEDGVAEVPIAMAEPRDEDVAFAYAFGPDGDPDTADADAADHGGEGGTVIIPAGETEATIRIPILDDDDIEPARESFAVTLTPMDDAGVAVSSAVVHIAEGVCDRTWQVADALRDGNACQDVTPAELDRRRTVRLPDAGLAELQPLDFLGLGSLTVLILDGNGLSALPEGLLTGSPKLRVLRLRGNRFEALPALGSLPELIELNLAGNLLAELPAAAFAAMPALGYLYLGGNRIEALPADLLAEAEAMRILELQDNALEALPAGLFAGVPKLFSLQLQGNPGTPFVLAVELARVEAESEGETGDGEAGSGDGNAGDGDAGDGGETEEEPGRAEIQLRAPHGAPFAIEAAISAPGATLSAQTATIAAGETLGGAVSVVRDVAGNEADATVAVEITSVTSLPTTACGDEYDEYRCFRGFELRPGSPLTLFEPPAVADVPTMR